jgi:beta-phosphoglucomutase-like phosphatase (HAD superfamily)
VATSTRGDLARKKLDTVHLLSFFRSVTGGDSVEHGKPAPDIYLAAATTLSVAPEECVAFEDSSPGTLSAAAAGMRAVIVPDLKAPSPEARAVAAAQIASLLDAPALFQ